MLSEAKDTSELMVDLGYASLFFGDTRMADEVTELEERLTDLIHEMREVCVLAHRLLEVLAAAHEKGVVHRDVKPENLFLTEDGALKVLDFGIARLLESTERHSATRTGTMIGTAAFMAPEQALGQWSQVDGQSDLWAVGAILFAMLAGRHVHLAETPNEALLKAMTTST